jgi:putative PIN family toxin of toxin-antitoxin system
MRKSRPTVRNKGLRLVLDTNTAVSGLIWQGKPGGIIDAGLAEKVQLLSSVPLLAELEGVLQRSKFQQALQRRGVKLSDLFNGYAAMVECVAPVELVKPICRDPDDDKVLAAAIGGDADLIVSGDDDLLALGNYRSIEILSARDVLILIENAKS